jgi:hypothetical protein
LSENGAVERFLARARQRCLLNLAIAEAGFSVALVCGGAILLLLLGTQILNWYWLAALLVGGLGFGVYRLRLLAPSTYRVAQRVDRELHSHDALSTAYYFSKTPPMRNLELVHAQRKMAERLAAENNPVIAVPLSAPRIVYIAAGLFVVVASLFGLRYGLLHTLDLRAPIADIQFNPFNRVSTKQEMASRKSAIQEKFDEQLQQLGISVDTLDSQMSKQSSPAEQAASALATPDGEEPMSSPEKGQSVENGKTQEGKTEGSDDPEGATSSTGKPADGQPDGASTEAQAGQESKQGAQNANGKNPQGENSSLADKMRDAVANLLSKLKSPGKQSDSQDKNASSAQGQSGAKQKQDSKGTQGQGKTQGEGQQNPDQQADQEGDGEQSASQNRPGDRNAEKPGQQDAKSGIGRQDGAKDSQEAEQLAAMGKISEILGKRAQQVSGEMTVEVASGKQQLKTAYSQKNAQHSDSGSDMNRDEIPLIYQPYVQRYFEEIHKAAPGPRINANERK